MANEAELDKYRGQIGADTWNTVVAVLRAPEFDLPNLKGKIGEDNWRATVEILRAPEFNIPDLRAKVDALDAKLDAILAKLPPRVDPPVTNPPVTSSPPATPIYTVVKGDTLSAIATTLRCTTNALVAANPAITDRNVLAVGQVLTIPRVG